MCVNYHEAQDFVESVFDIITRSIIANISKAAALALAMVPAKVPAFPNL